VKQLTKLYESLTIISLLFHRTNYNSNYCFTEHWNQYSMYPYVLSKDRTIF